ncbi:MAG: hypothetical protein EP343_00475 [Deltaproteobacteria bacterium]|nr:MAG: hypothetical protein EP343_00475 [Deltaproteobacteria bacterium]
MSQLRSMLKQDTRFIKRELRNARVPRAEVNEMLDALPDVSENARWMHPDGTSCEADEQTVLLSYHEEGAGKLYFSDKE